MYRRLRVLHRICGLIGALFLILISVTGFALALKSIVPAIKAPTQKGAKIDSPRDLVHPHVVMTSAFGVGLPELAEPKHIDRLELHNSKNIYKVTSKEGYHEVQIDGATGKVLSVSKRNDQLLENIHDLSFFNESFRVYILPIVALMLFILGVSGLVIYFTPIFRRIQFKRQKPA